MIAMAHVSSKRCRCCVRAVSAVVDMGSGPAAVAADQVQNRVPVGDLPSPRRARGAGLLQVRPEHGDHRGHPAHRRNRGVDGDAGHGALAVVEADRLGGGNGRVALVHVRACSRWVPSVC
jgi:hypothetical protein